MTGLPASRWMIGGAVKSSRSTHRPGKRPTGRPRRSTTTAKPDVAVGAGHVEVEGAAYRAGIAEGLCDEELGQDAAHDVGLEVAKCPALEHDAGVAQQRPSRRRTPLTLGEKNRQYEPRRLASTVPQKNRVENQKRKLVAQDLATRLAGGCRCASGLPPIQARMLVRSYGSCAFAAAPWRSTSSGNQPAEYLIHFDRGRPA